MSHHPRPVSHGGAIYAYGKAFEDASPGIYRSPDHGRTWTQVVPLDKPQASALTVHGDYLYIGTLSDADNTAHIYRLGLPPD